MPTRVTDADLGACVRRQLVGADPVVERVGPDYFQVMGIPVVRGRGFDDRDRPDTRAGPAAAVRAVAASRALRPARPGAAAGAG
jgi:hypothetical protein